jgi:hypothetical protein
MSEENVERARRGFEAYVRGDFDEVLAPSTSTQMSSTNKLARNQRFADEMRFGPRGNVGKLNGTRWR